MNEDVVRHIVGEIVGGDPSAPPPAGTTRLDQDLGYDSLDRVELAMALEDEFPTVTVSDEEVFVWKTVEDVVAAMRTKASW